MVKQNTGKWFRHGSWWKKLFLNRRYKDVLFRRLFRDKKDLLDLYNALNGSTYTDPGELEPEHAASGAFILCQTV